ncbi:MAG: serine hydrolase domain-containing protein [Polyangiales bacterium]
MRNAWPLLFLAACLSNERTSITSPLEHRLRGDRSGACVALALIADGKSERGTVCAGEPRPFDADTAFEIGSISKTMTGFVIATLIAEGKLALNDPIELYLPAGTKVPRHGEQPIRIEHLLSHSAGLPPLPSRMMPRDGNDPYADLSEQQLFDSLADVQLSEPPGTSWAYSNYGYMLLSYIASTLGGADLEVLLRERLFRPLGMHAFVAQRPAGVHDAQGHLALGIATAPWTFPAKLSGLGGVHATLDDMIRYAEAALGTGDPGVVATIKRTSEIIRQTDDGPAMGMGWIRQQEASHVLLLHDGGTGGFSSIIVIDPESGRAVVALSDTALTNTGGLSELAAHVLFPDEVPLDLPRKLATPNPELLTELQGRYALDELGITLVVRDGSLFMQPEGQPELQLGYDSYGDFYPTTLIDAVLTPVRKDGAPITFDWKQGGGMVRAVRLP